MATALPAPVLVGAAALSRRVATLDDAAEPVALMVEAAVAAADDAGSPGLLGGVDVVIVPRGMWTYPDPGRIVARRIGAPDARTVRTEIGILQTSLVTKAAQAIADGARAVLVVGGEARHRARLASASGAAADETAQPGATPDEVWKPVDEIVHPVEVARNLVTPAHAYAVIETRWRAERGLDVEEHRRDLADLWHRFSDVAAANPLAWDRRPHPAAELLDHAANPYLAFPYTRRHVSQWNVDQAAALLFCSPDQARTAGVARDRWVHPHAVTESNHMVPLVARGELHRSAGFRLAGRAAFELSGTSPGEIEHLELYSCFPVAVRVQCDELGIDPGRQLTLTGGMAFAGGPLNSFVLQALARAVEVLRAEPSSRALVTAVSGMLTKQGVSIWSAAPPAAGRLGVADVELTARAETAERSVDADATGPATIAGYTVVHDRDGPVQAVAVCDVEGARTVATSTDAAVMEAMEREEWCGRAVTIPAPGDLAP
jgi:acetyl-CoA C-acetyltransferase